MCTGLAASFQGGICVTTWNIQLLSSAIFTEVLKTLISLCQPVTVLFIWHLWVLCGLLKGFSCQRLNTGFSVLGFFPSVLTLKELLWFFFYLFLYMSLFIGWYLIPLKIYSFYHVLIQASKTMSHFEFRPNSPAMTWHSSLGWAPT